MLPTLPEFPGASQNLDRIFNNSRLPENISNLPDFQEKVLQFFFLTQVSNSFPHKSVLNVAFDVNSQELSLLDMLVTRSQ